MAKFKVYELAKEVDRSSKEVLAFLQENGIEAKAAQSSVEDAAADMIRKHFGGKAEAPKTEEVKAEVVKEAEVPKAEEVKTEAPKAEEVKTAEAPKKKKNIVFVSNPQYSKMPGGQRTTKNNNNQKPNNKPVQESKPAPKQIQLGPNQMINKSTGKVMEMLPPKKPEVVEEPVVVQEEKAPVKPNRENGNNNRNNQERTNNNSNRSNERGNDRGNDRVSLSHRMMKEEQGTVIMQENRDREEITGAMVINLITVIIKALIKVTIIIKMVTGAIKITTAVREEMKDRTLNSSLKRKVEALLPMHR